MPSVLLVHGDARARDSVAQALASMGFQITVQPDAASGWPEALQDAFDLILWDAAQSVIDGDALPALLAASGQNGSVWAVAAKDQAVDASAATWQARGFGGCLIWSGQMDEDWRQVLAPFLPQDGTASRWEGLTFEALPGFERLLQRYRQRLPGQMAGIHTAWAQQDRGGLQHLAHALKGTAECFGMPEVSRLAAQIEHTAEQGESAVIASWIGRLDAVVREATGPNDGACTTGETV